MIAEIQKFEDAARMAMGQFEAPRPRPTQTPFYSLERRMNWAILAAAAGALAVVALI